MTARGELEPAGSALLDAQGHQVFDTIRPWSYGGKALRHKGNGWEVTRDIYLGQKSP